MRWITSMFSFGCALHAQVIGTTARATPRASCTRSVLACLFSLAMLSAATSLAEESNVDFPRFPSVSPDGSQVVFSWRGDLWKAPTTGGHAIRLTSHPADELMSAWSPDGQWIAFNSARDGHLNIWMMRADGTGIRQVTDIDRTCVLTGFGTDEAGEQVILFSSSLEPDVYRSERPFMISIHGGDIRRIHDAYGSQPVMSPDGSRVAFVRGGFYSGFERRHSRGPETMDVWLWTRSDGSFRKLTDWPGNDGHPQWRHNDSVIYLSDRELNTVNLYAHNAVDPNARPRRLTGFRDRDIREFAVSADGSTAVITRWDELWSLDLTRTNAHPQPIIVTANEDEIDNYELRQIGNDVRQVALSPDGKVMAFVAYGEIYVCNIDEGSPTRRVTHSHARDRYLSWSPDGLKLYFTSDEDGTESIYAATVALTRGEIQEQFQQATGIAPTPVETSAESADEPAASEPADQPDAKDDGVSGTWTCSAQIPDMGELPFTMTISVSADHSVSGHVESDAGGGPVTGTYDPASRSLEITITTDQQGVITMSLAVGSGTLTGTATIEGTTVRIEGTRTAAAVAAEPAAAANTQEQEVEPAESDDSQTPRELDPSRWHDALRFNIEPIVQTAHNDYEPQPSPDGKYLSFKRNRGDLVLLDLETNEQRIVFHHWDQRMEWRFSPDGTLLAYTRNDLNFNSDIFIAPVDGSWEPVNITQHPKNDYNPRWSQDGKILSFISDRVGGEFDVYLVFLDKDLEALTELELKQYFEQANKNARQRKPLPVKRPNTENKSDNTTSVTPGADLDLADAYLRLRRVTTLTGSETGLEMTPAGDRLIFNGTHGSRALFSVLWDGSDRKQLTGAVNTQHMSLTGDKVVFLSGNRAGMVNPNGGSPTFVTISDRTRIDLAEQASQKFLEAARFLGDMFYHNDMKGLDWKRLTHEYHQLAKSTRTPGEFNDVANRLLGELSGSHLGVRSVGGYRSPNTESHGRLGTRHERVVLDDGRHGFRIISIVRDAPASKGRMALRVNDIITAIDLEPIGEHDTVEIMLKGRIGQELPITVLRAIDDNPVEIILLHTPISSGQERSLAYDDWRLSNAELVSEWSDGRLGYIHIQGMNQPSLDVFERDLFAAANGKEGLLIDVRNNGGGWTADRLLASIMAPVHAYTVPRGSEHIPGHYPQDRLFIQRYALPINMLCNEKSFSNAEITAHAFKTLGRGTLVGQETWGGVISTGSFSLIDGTTVRLPFRGWYLLDGTDMENNGAVPDVIVPQVPEDEARGVDAQLRAAVDDILVRLKP